MFAWAALSSIPKYANLCNVLTQGLDGTIPESCGLAADENQKHEKWNCAIDSYPTGMSSDPLLKDSLLVV